MQATIYHNPRCSKSRKTLELLENQNIDIKIIKYLETPPCADELAHVLKLLNLKPEDLLRKNEEEYKTHIKAKDLNESELLELMIAHPKVIERPIVVIGDKAVIGRPPENVLDIIK